MSNANIDNNMTNADQERTNSPPLSTSAAHPTGPWDVVLHVVSRFPTFALTIAVVGVLFWGAGYIITQSTKAQNELAEARSQIAEERTAHQDALAALTIEANTRIAAREREAQVAIENAREAQAAADVTVALAKAEALAAIQDTLLDTSDRIQNLVEGQLSSMEELEKVRTATAGELNRQLKELGDRRAELEAELARRQEEVNQKNLELELSRVTLALEVLFETVDGDQSYRIADDARTLTGIVDLSNNLQLEWLLERLDERGDHTISAAVFYAIYIETTQQEWLDHFIETMSPTSRIQTDWLSQVGWGAGIPNQAWDQIAGLVLDEIDQGIDEPGRTGELLHFLTGLMPFDLQDDPKRMGNHNMWRYVLANIGELRNSAQRRFGGRDFRALGALYDVAPAAAHVWVHQLSQDSSISLEDKEWLSDTVNGLNERGLSTNSPTESLVAFWTDPALIDRADDYEILGTSDIYEDQQ